MFLLMLDMIRAGEIGIRQDKTFGEIIIEEKQGNGPAEAAKEDIETEWI